MQYLRSSPLLALGALLLALSGCGPRPTTVRPPVSTSLGYVVFQELGAINRAPVHIGLLIDKQLQGLMFNRSGQIGTTEIPLGQILAAKLIQVASYRFDRITLVENADNAPPLLLYIGLQGGEQSVGVEINVSTGLGGASTFDVIAKMDLNLRATFTDHGQTIWVGAPRLVEEMKSGGAMYGLSDAGTQASDITHRVTDLLVAQFAQQMRRSESLQHYLEGQRP